MTTIRRIGTVFTIAAALCVPTLASAEAPTQLCDGMKGEHKAPTAENDKQQSNENKTDKKSQEKSDPKQTGKVDPNQSSRS